MASLTDLLGDLMHWADRNGVDFTDELARAQRHYAAEIAPELVRENEIAADQRYPGLEREAKNDEPERSR